jgi:hypothetical protein
MPSFVPPPPNATSGTSGVDPTIVSDIRRASQATHIDFSYLMAQAAQESSFQPKAKAASSSATGLYQFIDSTWLRMVKQVGGKYGLGQYANEIQQTSDGEYKVSDPTVRKQILNLRTDPGISASLGAEFAKQNKQDVEQALGHPANATDLYLAHFLGAAGATELVKTIETNGSVKAADLLPDAAEANRSVFYDTAGQPKTVAQIYKSFSEKLDTQISQFGGSDSVGDNAEVVLASADVSSGAIPELPADVVAKINQPMASMMNVIALAAMKLLGQNQPTDQHLSGHDKDRRRETAGTTV